MKTSTIVFIAFSQGTNLVFAQKKELPNLPIDQERNKISYAEVVAVDSLTDQEELYRRGRQWFAKTLNTSPDAIQLDVRENGTIVGKSFMQVFHRRLNMNFPSGYIHYTVSLYLKDGRYKYEVTNFHHIGQWIATGDKIPDYGPCEEMIHADKKFFNYYLMQVDENTKRLIADLKVSMNRAADAAKNKDEW